ncbi:SsrA-binding protein SmpB [Nitrosophilus alvini]|uniref:SsrA-binding protein SmpB n=1 Tax=Nitrosophilus alvini TaxID=2714855 RepID=UPI001909E2AF|nr:SsrA-binding protein SmpB [Nitrosophilus alvini]
MKVIARNKKAFHDFEILERFEAGIVLEGSEVKAIRAGRVNLKDSFIKIVKGEPFIFGMHISHLSTSAAHFRPDEKRPRKLLLHKKEINKLIGKTSEKGLTIVPLKLYFNNRNIAKLEIALAKGKTLHDKREAIKKKMMDKEARAAMKNY